MIVRRSNSYNRRIRTKVGVQGSHLLELRARRDSFTEERTHKINALLIKVIVLGLFLLLLFVGGRILLDKFFFTNPNYNIEHLEVSLDEVMTLEELKTLTGLHEGTNIFQVDLSAAEKILSDVPEVKKAHIERLLPNTIQVSLERRVPVFRLASSPEEALIPGKSFVVDQSGVLMIPKKIEPSLIELPLLLGIDQASLILGKPVKDEKFFFAIGLRDLLVNDQHPAPIMIRSFDLSREYCARVTDDGQAQFVFSEENLPAQVERLHKLLTHCQETGRQIETANLILEHNTPVTFRFNRHEGSPRSIQGSASNKKELAR